MPGSPCLSRRDKASSNPITAPDNLVTPGRARRADVSSGRRRLVEARTGKARADYIPPRRRVNVEARARRSIRLSLFTRLAGVAEDGEELAAHRLALRDGGHAFERRRVGVRPNAVAEDVDDGRAARAVSVVGVRAVNHARVMERALARLEFDGDGLELLLLLGGQHRADRVHVARESGDGQVGPA